MSETDTQAAPAQDPAQDTSTGQDAQGEASELTTEAPEASQGEQTDVKAEDTAGEKLFAGKYKTAEDMEKAYKELESKFGQTTSEMAGLQRILNEAFVTPETATQTEDTDYNDTGVSAPAADDSTKRDVAVMKFAIAYPDADGAAMNEVLAKDPVVKSINGYDAKLKYAYAQSKLQGQNTAIAEAQKRGAQEAQAKVAEKTAAQVETARKSETTDEKSDLKERMTTGSLEQREAARWEYIRKYLV